MSSFKTIEWVEGKVRMIDQTLLPGELRYIECEDVASVAEAIKSLRIRGAPAIGVAAGFGIALHAVHSSAMTTEDVIAELHAARQELGSTRPTAVNLFWALDRMMRCAEVHRTSPLAAMKQALLAESLRMCEEDVEANRTLGRLGAALLPDPCRILTHCNAGALATAGYGTALGIVRAAVEAGKQVHVYADETRPVLQGARLTAWELTQDGIPTTLLTDNMAASLMRQGKVDCVIVGADRIAANGDVANKIGTYGLAVLAQYHNVPFYVAAPTSTIDPSLPSGEAIPIEQRNREEVTQLMGARVAPTSVDVINPAFDVTPHELVTAIVTERTVFSPPYRDSIHACLREPTSSEVNCE